MDPSLTTSPEEPTRELRTLVAANRFHDALDHFQRDESGSLRHLADAELLAATAATRVGRDALGEELASDATWRFFRRGDEDGRMRTANLLGAIYWKRGHLKEAERCFGEALGLAHRLDDGLLLARASNNLALLHHLRGNATAALPLFRVALLSFQRLGDRRGTAETYHNLGLAHRHVKAWD